MEAILGVLTGIAVVGDVILGFATFWQRRKKKTAESKLDIVAATIKIIEDAIERNKGVIENTDIGKRIVNDILPEFETVVRKGREISTKLYESITIAREHVEHLEREIKIKKADGE